jgi:hypothetical protein
MKIEEMVIALNKRAMEELRIEEMENCYKSLKLAEELLVKKHH